MCHASWPMASTSWVWLLRAITVGSLSTMPRPLAYTSVLAVPRSMARSLARPALPARRRSLRPAVSPAVPVGVGRQRLQLAGETLHVGLHRPRLAVPHPQHQRSEHRQHDGNTEVDEIRHGATAFGGGHDESSAVLIGSLACGSLACAATSSTGWLHSAQSLPPSHVSRFQMGTVDLRVSMQKRAASKASLRWGADTATRTAVSPTSRTPRRCRTA